MFYLPTENVLEEESRALLPILEKALEAVEQKFRLFGEEKIAFTAYYTPSYSYKYQLQSEPLPFACLGVWAYAVQEMRLNIELYVSKEDKDKITVNASFRYKHRDGGSNGHDIHDFGESKSLFIYSKEADAFVPSVSYYGLSNLMKELLDIKKFCLPEAIAAELSSVFTFAESRPVGEEELSDESKYQIGTSLLALVEKLEEHLAEIFSNDSFLHRQQIERILDEAKAMGQSLIFKSPSFN